MSEFVSGENDGTHQDHENGIGRAGSLLTSTESNDSVLLGDIDAYVAETSPDDLPRAEAEIDGWVKPVNAYTPDSTLRPNEGLVSIIAVQSESEAEIVMGVLEAAGIPASLDGLASPTMGSIFNPSEARWGDILVPQHLEADARAVLQPANEEAGTDSGMVQDMPT